MLAEMFRFGSRARDDRLPEQVKGQCCLAPVRYSHLDFFLRCLYTVSLEFDWDAANIEHVARHRATPREVEQVFANEPMIVGAQEDPEEERFLCFGRTNTGRFLTVIYTERRGKIRVVTCYRMTRAQQRMYLTGR